ncbi:hypothetical protein J5U23_00651 [Saccharolobus shibatae B12]|uniref:Uncharacterized protein n=2 Tax=Saccharolobus shibatae TaxID=2286 RepID=A0A8F5BM04_SACSH|nr:hypothetical protein J5U23_00651 [Saccharolobus shibatae B12]QXJ34136.1 hypothetical protein J5U22_00681 [Saccharolobus shibatae]
MSLTSKEIEALTKKLKIIKFKWRRELNFFEIVFQIQIIQ